jgi:hypothetical protein
MRIRVVVGLGVGSGRRGTLADFVMNAEWLVERLSEEPRTLVGIDHGFSFLYLPWDGYDNHNDHNAAGRSLHARNSHALR